MKGLQVTRGNGQHRKDDWKLKCNSRTWHSTLKVIDKKELNFILQLMNLCLWRTNLRSSHQERTRIKMMRTNISQTLRVEPSSMCFNKSSKWLSHVKWELVPKTSIVCNELTAFIFLPCDSRMVPVTYHAWKNWENT